MNLFRTVAAIVSAAAILAACAGETQLQTNVGFSSAPPAATGMTANDVGFPQECYVNGKLTLKEEPSCYGKGDQRYCSEASVLCTCMGHTTIVRWARLKSADNGNPQYGYCPYHAPDPNQVDRVPIGGAPLPAASSAQPIPRPVPPPTPPMPSASASAAPVASVGPVAPTPPVDPSQLNGSPSCAMKDNVLTCRVLRVATAKNAEPAKEYSCVGGNYVPLGIDALAKYDGKSAPCTCTVGTLKKMDNPPNTWWCDTGK